MQLAISGFLPLFPVGEMRHQARLVASAPRSVIPFPLRFYFPMPQDSSQTPRSPVQADAELWVDPSTQRRRRRRKRKDSGREKPRLTSRPWFILVSFFLALGCAIWLTYLMWKFETSGARAATSRAMGAPVAQQYTIEARREASRLLATAFSELENGERFSAYRKFSNLHATYPGVPALLPTLLRLAIELGQQGDIETLSLAANRTNISPADHARVLVIMAHHLGASRAILHHFDEAHVTDPLNPDILYQWGLSLRQAGMNKEAIQKFRQSLERSHYSLSSGYLIGIQLRLAELEDSPQSMDADINEKLGQPDVDGETYLLASARSLLAGDLAAGAEHLRNAKQRIPAPFFNRLMLDPIFQAVEGYPEFDNLLPPRQGRAVQPALAP